MQRKYILTVGKILPHDEPCKLTKIVYEPKVRVEKQYKLSEKDIEEFYTNGFMKPFTVFDPQEIKELGKQLLEHRKHVNPIYGQITDRDWHLAVPEMLLAMKHPAIIERLAQLLGPNLLAWRSQIFYKPPGGKTITWHQASTYLFEEGFTKQLLIPPDINELFMLTIWIPCDPVTIENGCLQFIKNSLRGGIKNMKLGGSVGFDSVNFSPDYEVDPNDIQNVEMDLGQVLIFSERTIHGSPPNNSDRNRFAFNYRVTPTNVKAYPDPNNRKQHKESHKATQMAEKYDLANWSTTLLRGKANDLNRFEAR